MTNILKRYNDTRLFLINEASFINKLVLAFAFAFALALTSQIKIYLWFTPIPVSIATLTVCASALTLGGFWSFVSVAIYLFAAALGLPVTASGNIIAASSGYLVGYALCALVLGKYTENNKAENVLKTSAVLFISHISIIHVCGMIGLYIWSVHLGTPYTLSEVFMKGSLPFILGDSIKAICLSYIMALVLKNHN